MTNPSCDTCRFAEPTVLDNVDGAPDAVLLCRRYPPTMVPDDGAFGPVWTIVAADVWCGEHTPREEP